MANSGVSNDFRPYDRLVGIGTRQCEEWRKSIFKRHRLFMHSMVDVYEKLVNTTGYVSANQWLGLTEKRMKLGTTGLYIDSHEEALNEYAIAKSRATERHILDIVNRLDTYFALDLARKMVNRTGISFPYLPDEPTKRQIAASLMRVCDDKWWRKNLRKLQWSEMESLCREFGLVSKRKGIYISDFSYARCRQQKIKNRRLMEAMEAENEEGQAYKLSELSDLSVSNPENRRNELMVRMNGFEEFAKNSDEKWVGVFYTLTCPSKYHATHQTGKPNEKYNGSTPKQANDYLNNVWQRVRSALHRREIYNYGFRVVEPHHDGTPHWHLMLFFKSDQEQQATELFKSYAMQEDGNEKGAGKYRFKAVYIDPKKGSATGYIAKYISKNIDGHGVEADLYGREAVASAARIAAWASLWGIRQFQQIGGASVTVWRELRRLEAKAIEKHKLKEIIVAADEGNWEEYTELMGGVICPRIDRPLRPLLARKSEMNSYGEFPRILKGLFYGALEIITRVHSWTVKIARSSSEQEETNKVRVKENVDGVYDLRAPPKASAPLEFCQ